jgi:hypothetical protein
MCILPVKHKLEASLAIVQRGVRPKSEIPVSVCTCGTGAAAPSSSRTASADNCTEALSGRIVSPTLGNDSRPFLGDTDWAFLGPSKKARREPNRGGYIRTWPLGTSAGFIADPPPVAFASDDVMVTTAQPRQHSRGLLLFQIADLERRTNSGLARIKGHWADGDVRSVRRERGLARASPTEAGGFVSSALVEQLRLTHREAITSSNIADLDSQFLGVLQSP